MNQHVPPPTPQPVMVTGPDGALRPLRFDPDGASIGPEVSDDLILRWRRMLADCGAAQARLHRNYEGFFKNQEACIRVMAGLLADASGIAEDLRELADLYELAVTSQGIDGKLAQALRLVHSSMTTMADRLDALENQGDAVRARYGL